MILIFPRELNYEFAIAATICTAAMLFFPAVHGSYSATHGPVTALQSIYRRFKIWLAMALAALHILGCRLVARHSLLFTLSNAIFSLRSSPPDHVFALRC